MNNSRTTNNVPACGAQAASKALSQGCIKLQFEGSAGRGGDSLSPYYQARRAGDKLSPPPKTELDAALPKPGPKPFLLAHWPEQVYRCTERIVTAMPQHLKGETLVP